MTETAAIGNEAEGGSTSLEKQLGLTLSPAELLLNASNGSLDGSNSGRSSPSLGAGSGSNGSVTGYDSKLFVGGLSWQTTPEKLRDYFSQFGTVLDVLVMKDPVTQVSS